ncbi:uncharacterized protein [Macrobrachium rosenbergii]|uniref:uncharacterized protein n=1 Tax=Macrobrachium rosenbergii TaxID=79674 RepID=UPI0034D6A6B2
MRDDHRLRDEYWMPSPILAVRVEKQSLQPCPHPFWWGIKPDIKKWARECLQCQTSKITRHTETGIGEFHTTQQQLAHIQLTSWDPSPTEGDGYLFTITDRNVRQPEVIQVRQQTAESCVKALIGWVSRHGVPQYITSNRRANFTSTLWSSLAASLGTILIHTTETTGMVQRLHCSIKSVLTARCQGGSWRKELLWVWLGLRTAPHAAFNALPAKALYGEALVIPAYVFQNPTEPTTLPDIHRLMENIMPVKTTYDIARKEYVPEDLKRAKYMFIRIDAYKPHSLQPTRDHHTTYRNGERKCIS